MKKYLLLLFMMGITPCSNIMANCDLPQGKCVSITPQSDGSYLVVTAPTSKPSSFEWYLSYKGKRVSDYYKSVFLRESVFADAITWSQSVKVWAWPDEVPVGHEKYVTVQLGREPRVKDRRDDD